MGVIELNGNLLRELTPCTLRLLEATDDIIQRCSYPEVLLLKTKLLTAIEIVIGVQDSTDSLSTLLVTNRALIIATVKLLEIKLSACSLTGPETQVIGSRRVKSRNGYIVCNRLDNLTTFPDSNLLSSLVLVLSYISIELDLKGYLAQTDSKLEEFLHQQQYHVLGIPMD